MDLAGEEQYPENFPLSAFPQIAYNPKRDRGWRNRLLPRSCGIFRVALAQRNVAMNGITLRIRLVGCAVLLAGCISPQNTRLPTLGYSRDTRTERERYNYLYPLPDQNFGTPFEQPRGFEFSRAQPRRAQENYATTEAITGGAGAVSSPAASRYPNSVNP